MAGSKVILSQYNIEENAFSHELHLLGGNICD